MLPIDFCPETRYFYGICDEEERNFYEFIVERLLKLEFEFLLYDPNKAPLSEAELACGLPAFPCPDFEEYMFAGLCITFHRLQCDCPEFYYAYSADLHFDEQSRTVRIGNGKPEYTPEEIRTYNKALDDILHRFDDITDDFELELAVHDYVTSHYHYDRNDDYDGQKFNEMFTVIGFLKSGGAVCEAYTFLVQFILQRRGIPCAHLIGMAINANAPDDEEELHAWLAVKIKGNYYHLDPTFNDDDEENGLSSYSHFNLTDEEIRRDREFKNEYYPGIRCNATEYNYFVATGRIYTTKEELSEAARCFAQDAYGKQEVAYFRFKAPGIGWECAEEAIIRPIGKLLVDYDAYFHEPDIYVIKLMFKK